MKQASKMKKQVILLGLLLGVLQFAQAQLTGITPNSGQLGQTLQTTISSNFLFVQTMSPSGNIYDIHLKRGTEVISIFDFYNMFWGYTEIIDASNVSSQFTIPINATPGVYDLYVTVGDPFYPIWNQVTYMLPACFTVAAPNGVISGNIYRDLNRNGVRDAGEPAVTGSGAYNIQSQVYQYTDNNGNFSLPGYNGTYDITHLSTFERLLSTTFDDTVQVTVNNGNVPNVNFGLNSAILSITPSTAVKGSTAFYEIVADRPLFLPGSGPNGNIQVFQVLSSPSIYVPVSTNITILDSYRIRVNITVPSGTAGGTVDFRMYLNNGIIGYHYLRQQLSIIDPPVCTTPLSPFASNITASSMRINWTQVPNVYRYQVFYKVGGTSTWLKKSVNNTKTFLNLTGLNCGTNYRWKIRSICTTPLGNIQSTFSPVVVTPTLACGPPVADKLNGSDEIPAELLAVDIYPNPVTDLLTVDLYSDSKSATVIQIADVQGKLLIQKQYEHLNAFHSEKIDVSGLKSGLYFVRITGAVNAVERVVIER